MGRPPPSPIGDVKCKNSAAGAADIGARPRAPRAAAARARCASSPPCAPAPRAPRRSGRALRADPRARSATSGTALSRGDRGHHVSPSRGSRLRRTMAASVHSHGLRGATYAATPLDRCAIGGGVVVVRPGLRLALHRGVLATEPAGLPPGHVRAPPLMRTSAQRLDMTRPVRATRRSASQPQWNCRFAGTHPLRCGEARSRICCGGGARVYEDFL